MHLLKALKVLELAILTLLLSAALLFAEGLKTDTIATLDQEKLYRNSLFGQRVVQEINEISDELLANELLLQSQLEIEEKALTKKRKIIEIEEFKILAAEFDKKVQRIRADTTEARIKLNRYSESERSRFFELSIPVLIELSEELGVTTLLDNRTVIISLNDITAYSVIRVDEKIGDGTAISKK
jgi:Skp family chaperone for outer membrane proteins